MSDPEVMKIVDTRNSEDSTTNREDTKQWVLYVDATSNENGSGAGMMFISPEGYKIHYTLRFGFTTSNNEVVYEALIA